jgi:hypothetical protein
MTKFLRSLASYILTDHEYNANTQAELNTLGIKQMARNGTGMNIPYG